MRTLGYGANFSATFLTPRRENFALKWSTRLREAPRGGDGRERVSWLGLLGTVALLAGAAFLYAYPRLREPPLVRRDFVGRVVDRYLTLGESQIGTRGSLTLLVEDGAGRRFRVAVTDEVYERARVGMWVRRRGGVVEVSWEEPAAEAPPARGVRVEGR